MKVFITAPFSNFPTIMNILKKSNKNIIPIIGSCSLYPTKTTYNDLYNAIKQSNYSKIFPKSHENNLIKGISNYKDVKKYGDTILSVNMSDPNDIEYLNIIIPNNINIEINIDSNVRVDIDNYISNGIGDLISSERDFNICKVPYNTSLNILEKLYKVGFRQFHLNKQDNDPDLTKYHLTKIEEVDRYFFGDMEIIAGEIFEIDTIPRYRWCGAEHMSISTICMNPFKMNKLLNNSII